MQVQILEDLAKEYDDCAGGHSKAILFIRFRLNSLWLVLGGSIIGLLVHITGILS